MKTGSILVVPACERGRGGGHLGRSVFLVNKLTENGRDAFLWVDRHLKEDLVQRFPEFFPLERGDPQKNTPGFILSGREELSCRQWDLIVLDRFQTRKEEFAFWSALSMQNIPGKPPAALIGIDEGGPCRKNFDFLIDLLPSLSKHRPNLTAPWLLPLPKNRRPVKKSAVKREHSPLRVLIGFGAEDSAGLGLSAARFFASNFSLPVPNREAVSKSKEDAPAAWSGTLHYSSMEITLIASSLNNDKLPGLRQEFPEIKIIGKLPDLKEHLAEYNLFITHFGLGAFEAVYARVPVLLISPTPYHEKLARKTGVRHHFGAFSGRSFKKKFFKALEAGTGDIASHFNLEEDQKEDIGVYINILEPHSSGKCPVCECGSGKGPDSESRGKVMARFPEESFRRCPHCGTIYLFRVKPPSVEYEKDYFFDSYKKQYGKTYLEDFPSLKEMGLRRLECIGEILDGIPRKDGKPSLLDIGCAYGPFLAAAAECGFSCFGIEPAEDAVRYVKEKFGFTVWQGFFPDALPDELRGHSKAKRIETTGITGKKFNDGNFDVVTLWYVIEHLRETGQILREINRLLKKGGVLALSTPSFSGISGRRNLYAFLKDSPPDHFTVWRPGSCKRILRQYGFRLHKIIVTGHHPERFPFLGRFVQPLKKSFLYGFLLLISRLFRLGDTFEVYGVKTSELMA